MAAKEITPIPTRFPIVDSSGIIPRVWEKWFLELVKYFNIAGSIPWTSIGKKRSYAIVSVDTTVLASYDYIEADTSGITITLPAGSTMLKQELSIVNGSTGDITVSGSENIQGETSQTVFSGSCMKVIFNGTEWKIV